MYRLSLLAEVYASTTEIAGVNVGPMMTDFSWLELAWRARPGHVGSCVNHPPLNRLLLVQLNGRFGKLFRSF